MAERIVRVFRMAFDVTVTVHEIDDGQAQATKRAFNNDALAGDPSTQEMLERDRRLLVALLANAEALRTELLRHVSWALDPLHPSEQVLTDLGMGHPTDADLIERLQSVLPPKDVEEWRALCADDVFYDNMPFFQDAFATCIGRVSLLAAEAPLELPDQ